MKDEPSHWSERAKADLPPLPPSGLGPSKDKRPRRRSPFGSNPSKVVAITAACVLCLGIVGGGLAWYFSSGSDSSDTGGPTTASSDPMATTSRPTETTTPISVSASTSEVAPSTTIVPGGSTATTQTGVPSATVSTVPPGWMTFQEAGPALSFIYPEHWVQFPLEQASELTGPPTLGLAVGDPQGADFGTTPADYIFFGAYEESDDVRPPPAAEALEEWAMMTEAEWPEPLTTVEDSSAFRVNGLDAAAKLYSTVVQGETLYLRVCFVSAGTSMYIFVFRAEEEHWGADEQLFDSVLDSFKVVVDQ